MRTVRRLLDGLYTLSGGLAAVFLVVILLLIVAQMVARWTGTQFSGSTTYAGYAMAASSFLAFANALNRGAHIRVSLLLNAVPDRVRRALEVWCFGLGTAIAWYFTWNATTFAYWSWKFHDVSQAQDATPLWIPQSAMVIGGGILAIALTDNLVSVIFRGTHRIERDLIDQSFGE